MAAINFINLTPHAIVLRSAEGVDFTVPPSGTVARVATTPGGALPSEGFPCEVFSSTTFGEVEGLPAPAPDTVHIVSALVLGRVSRPDVFAPGTGPQDGAVRNDKGHIVAVTRLIRSC